MRVPNLYSQPAIHTDAFWPWILAADSLPQPRRNIHNVPPTRGSALKTCPQMSGDTRGHCSVYGGSHVCTYVPTAVRSLLFEDSLRGTRLCAERCLYPVV